LDVSRPRLVALRGDLGLGSTWTLYHLCPVRGYVTTLAVEGEGAELVWRSPVTAGSEMTATGF
jgi:hypothetical protein